MFGCVRQLGMLELHRGIDVLIAVGITGCGTVVVAVDTIVVDIIVDLMDIVVGSTAVVG